LWVTKSGGLEDCGKVRWSIAGHGKRGGVRVIYAPLLKQAVILLMMIYQKNAQDDITPEQKRVLRAVLEQEIARLEGGEQ
jgi:hypothetical protein